MIVVPQASGLTPAATAALAQAKTAASSVPGVADKARTAAEDFEAVYLNSMMQQMFSGLGEGPFGGGPAAGVWRSFLVDEYAKSFAKSGGIGIADHVQRALLAQQEVR